MPGCLSYVFNLFPSNKSQSKVTEPAAPPPDTSKSVINKPDMPSHVVVGTLPFASCLSSNNARELIERDKARAQKIAQGIHPHGPKAFKEARRRRHHHHHGHGGAGGDPPTSSPPTSDPGSAGVDVTDAGVTYTTSVGVGSPATQYTLLIDTGKCFQSPRRLVSDATLMIDR